MSHAGADYIERNYEAAAVEGRIVQIAFQAHARMESSGHIGKIVLVVDPPRAL